MPLLPFTMFKKRDNQGNERLRDREEREGDSKKKREEIFSCLLMTVDLRCVKTSFFVTCGVVFTQNG